MSSSSSSSSIPSPDSPAISPAIHPHPLPSASEDRIVRFDDACVLIPGPQSRSLIPKLLSKSYSLPIFRRRPHPDHRHQLSQTAYQPNEEKEDNVTHTFPRPFKKSPEPSRGFRFEDEKPLHSCLVHHDASAPASESASPRARFHARRPSLPLPERSDLVTIPLRPCCPDCFTVTESALLSGDSWTEHFTRAARRRRSASVDNQRTAQPQGPPGRASGAGWLMSSTTTEVAKPGFVGVSVDEVAKASVGVVVTKTVSVQGLSHVDSPEGSPAPEAEDVEESPRPEDSDDEYLPAILAHRPPRSPLSPIQSTNASVDDLTLPHTTPGYPQSPLVAPIRRLPATPSTPKTESLRTAFTSSPSSSSLLRTPPQMFDVSEFAASERELLAGTPSLGHSSKSRPAFHVPSGASFLRAGADMLKGVSVLSGPGSP